ncbi:hypothetical protein V8E51_019279 [Hyaloscypha variabilis]
METTTHTISLPTASHGLENEHVSDWSVHRAATQRSVSRSRETPSVPTNFMTTPARCEKEMQVSRAVPKAPPMYRWTYFSDATKANSEHSGSNLSKDISDADRLAESFPPLPIGEAKSKIFDSPATRRPPYETPDRTSGESPLLYLAEEFKLIVPTPSLVHIPLPVTPSQTFEDLPPLSLAGEVKPKILNPAVVLVPPPVAQPLLSNSTTGRTSTSVTHQGNTSFEVVCDNRRHVISPLLLQRCTRSSLPIVDAAIKQILEEHPQLERHYWYDVSLEASRDLVPELIHSPLIFDLCCSDCIWSELPCSGFQKDHPEKKCENCRKQGLRCIFRTVKQEQIPNWHYDDPRTRERLIRQKERTLSPVNGVLS